MYFLSKISGYTVEKTNFKQISGTKQIIDYISQNIATDNIFKEEEITNILQTLNSFFSKSQPDDNELQEKIENLFVKIFNDRCYRGGEEALDISDSIIKEVFGERLSEPSKVDEYLPIFTFSTKTCLEEEFKENSLNNYPELKKYLRKTFPDLFPILN